MIPVEQTRVGSGVGNCFAACLASILEIPVEDIPDFLNDGDEFLDQLAWFLFPYGLVYVQVEPDDPIVNRMFMVGQMWHTIEGVSPRGGLHACVGCNGQIVHDPHPGGNGLVKVELFGLLCARMSRPPDGVSNSPSL
jgi:hypothetical protein